MNQPKETRHGFLDEPLAPSDYTFGGKTKLSGDIINDDGDWEKLFFDDIKTAQAEKYETNGCVGHSSENGLQFLVRRMHGLMEVFSSRFIVVGSNTDPARGNTFKQVLQFIRDNWTVYEHEWSPTDAATVEEYYAPIPKHLYSIAKGRKRRLGYERITNPTPERIHEASRRGVVVMSTALWRGDDDIYFRPDNWQDSHAIVYMGRRDDGLWRIMDSYTPFRKTVKPYLPQAAYRITVDMKEYSLLSQLVELLTQLLKKLEEKIFKPVFVSPDLPERNPDDSRMELYQAAVTFLGSDIRSGRVKKELACVEHLVEVIRAKNVVEMPDMLHTMELKNYLRNDKKWKGTLDLLPGNIILSPTGEGKTGRIPNGHVGIILKDGKIASNNSNTGKWDDYYTIDTWVKRWRHEGGYPIYCFTLL